MIYICENMKTYQMSSIMEEDIEKVRSWYNLQNILKGEERKVMNNKEFEDCFLGYALSEEEFFIKITYSEDIVGIIKGHITKGQNDELWITNGMIDRGQDRIKFKEVLEEFLSLMGEIYGVKICFAGVFEYRGNQCEEFEKNGFEKFRKIKNYFTIDGIKIDGEILFKNC